MYLATYESVIVARGQRKENTDRVRNQSDCKIRYRASVPSQKKKNICIYQKICVQLVILYCKKICLTGRLRTLRFSIHFAFPAL